MTKWMKATEFYQSRTDNLRGKRRKIKAEQANTVRNHILGFMPEKEIIEALGGGEVAETKVNAPTGKVDVVRIRVDLLGFVKALRLRYLHNTSEDISLPNVMSVLAYHGMEGTLSLPEFQPVVQPAE